MTSFIAKEKKAYHAALLTSILRSDSKNIPTIADKGSDISVRAARGLLRILGEPPRGARSAGQRAGSQFESLTADFVKKTFLRLAHLRPGKWQVTCGSGAIADFAQFRHLIALSDAISKNPELEAALGREYTIRPDITISRSPEPDEEINKKVSLVDKTTARLSFLREENNGTPILHASISCKWTIRSDRAQNSRSEALNLIRNRKSTVPHIAVVTAEPLPTRIVSIALGTGDIDCTYHFALPELRAALEEARLAEQLDLLDTMVLGNRLRDISDLPLDLAI